MIYGPGSLRTFPLNKYNKKGAGVLLVYPHLTASLPPYSSNIHKGHKSIAMDPCPHTYKKRRHKMPIRIKSTDITAQQLIDLYNYLESLKITYDIIIITDDTS